MSTYEEFAHLKWPLEEIIEATSNFADENLIGHGGFGKVYKGELSVLGGMIYPLIELYQFLYARDDLSFDILLESLSPYYHREHDAIYVEGIEFRPMEKVGRHNETKRSKQIQKVLKANSNLDHMLETPSENEMILKGSINYDYEEELFLVAHVGGKKLLMLSAMAALHNFSDSTLFNSIPSSQSRFEKVLQLLPQQIFHINCMIKSQWLSQDTEYMCYLVFKLSEDCHELHGPVEVRDLLEKHKAGEIVYFRYQHPWNILDITRVPIQREDGWMEVNVWKFKSDQLKFNDCVLVNLKLISYEGSMSGLIVCGLEFRPM